MNIRSYWNLQCDYNIFLPVEYDQAFWRFIGKWKSRVKYISDHLTFLSSFMFQWIVFILAACTEAKYFRINIKILCIWFKTNFKKSNVLLLVHPLSLKLNAITQRWNVGKTTDFLFNLMYIEFGPIWLYCYEVNQSDRTPSEIISWDNKFVVHNCISIALPHGDFHGGKIKTNLQTIANIF